MEEEADVDRLPIDLLAQIFLFITSFTDLAQARLVCKKWKKGVKHSLGQRRTLNFSWWKMDDKSTTRLVRQAYNLRELDISRSCWGCRITDDGLQEISSAKCIRSLTSISLWGMAGITDTGVISLISRATSLENLNLGGTFITDESLFAVGESCPNLKTIVLWSCCHVTERGLLYLVDKCRKLDSINVWGTRVPEDFFHNLLLKSPALQMKPKELIFNMGSTSLLSVA